MPINLNTSFDNHKTKARFNYLVDVLRGCWDDRDGYVPFDKMNDSCQQMYLDEANVDEYIIDETQIDDMENNLCKMLNK